jgi:putative membrane protein
MMWNYGMMGGWGWFGPFHFIIPLVFWALIIWAVVMLVRHWTVSGDRAPWAARRPPGLEVLEERYARGEINREEYLQKRQDILG